MELKKNSRKKDYVLVGIFFLLTIIVYFLPTGYEERTPKNSIRSKAEVIGVKDDISRMGMIRKGDQKVTLKIRNGPYSGKVVTGSNNLMGRMDIDKVFKEGDTALVVLTLDQKGKIIFVNPQDHYRIGLEILVLSLFAILLVAYGGFTGVKALLSFVFSAMVIWKLLVPLMLKGFHPIWLSLGIVTLLSASVIFLVAGPNKKGVVAFSGAMLGIITSAILSVYFTGKFHLHGAVMPFAETLLYSGFGHLNLVHIYACAVFFAASGAVMDLAMDVSASMEEVVLKNPGLSRMEIIASGFRVGRAVVGTMTTTLLFAYSGGYITLLMAFMAQGVPLANLFNMIYVAAEVLKTLVGSFGLVTVAPFTAICGGFVFASERQPGKREAGIAQTTRKPGKEILA